MTHKHKGWICLHRQILDWEYWDDHNASRLFIYLMIQANHEPKIWRGNIIERGDVLESMETMAKATGLTLKMVRTAILKLKLCNSLTIKKTKTGQNGFCHLSLCNYSLFQTVKNDEGQNKGRIRAELGQNLNNVTIKQDVVTDEISVFPFLQTLDFSDWNTREGYVRIGKALLNEYKSKGLKLDHLDNKIEEVKKMTIHHPNKFWRKVLTDLITKISETE